MNKYFFCWLIFFLALQLPSLAQRNIIDVPTSEIVEPKHLFFQEQVSISDRKIKSSTTFTLGIGKMWEGGITLNQVSFNLRPKSQIFIIDPDKPEDNSDLMINGQKGFQLKDWYTIGIGTRTGFSIAKKIQEIQFANYSFFNNSFIIPSLDHKFILGGYYGSQSYVGEGSHFGLQLAFEFELIKEKLEVFGEYISGANAIGIINLGMQVDLKKDWEMDIAIFLPPPGVDNSFGFVIQLARR